MNMNGCLNINAERAIRFYARLIDCLDLCPDDPVALVVDKINKELNELCEKEKYNKPDHTIKTMFEIGDHVVFGNGDKEWEDGYIQDIRVHVLSDKDGNYINRSVHYCINDILVHESWVRFYSDDWHEEGD